MPEDRLYLISWLYNLFKGKIADSIKSQLNSLVSLTNFIVAFDVFDSDIPLLKNITKKCNLDL